MSRTLDADLGDQGNTRAGLAFEHGPVDFIHYHVVELVTCAYLFYVVLGTLLPFDYSIGVALNADRSVLGLGNAPAGLPDVLSNIALYVPLGVLLHLLLMRWLGRPWLSAVGAVCLAGVVSLSIESVQLFSATRVSSLIDFAANLVGATSGALLALFCAGRERKLLSTFSSELRKNRLAMVTKMYAALLFIGALVPFTPTIDVSRIGASIRSSTLTPFAQTNSLAARADAAMAQKRPDLAAAYQRDCMHTWARWLAELASFSVLGWLLYRLLRTQYQFNAFASAAMVLYVSAGLAVVMSAAQIGIISRGFHVTDILARTTGALLGCIACGFAGGRARCRVADDDLCAGRWGGPALLIFALGLILLTGLAPFQFDLSVQRIAARLTAPEALPLYAYHQGRFDQVCADLWGKALQYGLLATALWWCRSHSGAVPARWWTLRTVLIALVLSASVEACQLVIRSRVPTLTDVITATLAAWIAGVIVQYVAGVYRYATSGRERSSLRRHRPVAPGHTDAAVTTWMHQASFGGPSGTLSEQPGDGA